MGVNILVAHGGGPTAVINTSLQGVVEGARASGKVDKIYAARYAAESACELALDASGLPIHVVVLELMGRNAGWVTAASALAARATDCEVLTYLPEL